jgi:SAM-dependent methyltransferase
MAADPSTRLAEMVAAAARAHALASPAPRGAPLFGLEHPSGSAVELLGLLASHGIFRKYELVLDLSAHLGASSRWLAATLGCTAVTTAPTEAEAAAAGSLTQLAKLGDQVFHTAADVRALPFAAARFTHVWIVESLAFLADPEAALAEAVRVLRPGGHLAIQELVRFGGSGPALPGARFERDGIWTAVLRRHGCVDLTVRDVSALAQESMALLTQARAAFAATLEAAARTDEAIAHAARERAALSASLASGSLRLIQIHARRP